MRAILVATLLVVGLTSSIGARAEDAPGGYIGISVGQTKVDDFCDGASSCDDTDVGWKIFGGYQFSKFLGIEGGYIDLGEANASGTITDPFFGTFSGSVDVEGWGVFVSGVGTLPIGDRFGVFGKVGAAYTDVEATVNGTSSVFGSISGSDSDNGLGLTFGVGAFMNILRNLSIRVEWERFQDTGGDFEGDVDLISGGVTYKF